MPGVKEVDDISKEIIKKLDEAIVQTVMKNTNRY